MENYTAWRTQFLNLLFGYDLLEFIDSSNPCPPENIISSTSGSPISNLDWKVWMRHDSFILKTIVGSISPNFTSMVTFYVNYSEA